MPFRCLQGVPGETDIFLATCRQIFWIGLLSRRSIMAPPCHTSTFHERPLCSSLFPSCVTVLVPRSYPSSVGICHVGMILCQSFDFEKTLFTLLCFRRSRRQRSNGASPAAKSTRHGIPKTRKKNNAQPCSYALLGPVMWPGGNMPAL